MIALFEDRFWICLTSWIIIRGFGLWGCLGLDCGLVIIGVAGDGVGAERVFGDWALEFIDMFAIGLAEGTVVAIAVVV